MILSLSEPELLSMSRNPVAFKCYTDAQTKTRLSVFCESEYGLADFARIYDEEKISSSSKPALFDFAEVLDSMLENQVPDPSLEVFQPTKMSLRYFVAGPERYSTETLVTTFVAAAGAQAIPSLSPANVYRIEVDYADGYTDTPTTLSETTPPPSSMPLFVGNEWIYDGRIIEVFKTTEIFNLLELATALVGQTVSIYQVTGQTRYVLKGGWNEFEWPERTTDTPAGNILLSYTPTIQDAWFGGYSWIWFLARGTNGFFYSMKVYDEDGNITNIPVTPTAIGDAFRPFAFNVSDSYWDFEAIAGSKVSKVEVTLSEDGFDEITVAFDYTRYDCLPYIRQFVYANNVGGYDTLVTYGKGQGGASIDAQESRRFIPADYEKPVGFVRDLQAFRERTSVALGYRTKTERDTAKAILISEDVWQNVSGKLLPITVIASSWSDENDGDHRYTLNFDYAYAFNSKNLRKP